MIEQYLQPPFVYVWLGPLTIWSFLWKAMALWKAGRNNQLAWFITHLFVHTLGLLDLVYILFFQKKLDKKR